MDYHDYTTEHQKGKHLTHEDYVKIQMRLQDGWKNSIVKCNNFLHLFLFILSHHNKTVNIRSFVGSLL